MALLILGDPPHACSWRILLEVVQKLFSAENELHIGPISLKRSDSMTTVTYLFLSSTEVRKHAPLPTDVHNSKLLFGPWMPNVGVLGGNNLSLVASWDGSLHLFFFFLDGSIFSSYFSKNLNDNTYWLILLVICKKHLTKIMGLIIKRCIKSLENINECWYLIFHLPIGH